MPRSLQTRLVGALAIGIVVGVFAVLVVGPVQPPDREGRLMVDDDYVESVRESQAVALGRPPDPRELARAVEHRIDSDVLAREAALRGFGPDRRRSEVGAREGRESGPVGHLQRVAATRWLSAAPAETEVIAFAELRRDRYAPLIPSERGLPSAGSPEWESAPDLARLLARARADIRTAERRASANQFLAEIAPRHPIALSRNARMVLDAGTGTEAASTAGEAGSVPSDRTDGGEGGGPGPGGGLATGGSAAWRVDPGDPWSGAASVFLEEAGDGRWDLTVLLPPRTAEDGVRLDTACGSDEDRSVLPVFAAGADPSAPSWRVAKGTLRCPAGAALADGELRVSTPAGVRGDMELRRLDGATFVSTFGDGGGTMDLSRGATSSRGAVREAGRGLVDVLGILAVWVLGSTLGWLRPGRRALGLALIGFGGGYGLGWWTSGTGGPTTAFGVPEILTLLAAVTLAVVSVLHRGDSATGRALGFSIGVFFLLGLLFGGTAGPSFDAALSQAGRWIDTGTGLLGSLAGGAGAALAVAPMMAAGVALASLPGWRRKSRPDRPPSEVHEQRFGWILGVAGVAGIVALAWSAFVAFPPDLPGAQLDACILAGMLGAVLALSGVRLDGSALATAGLLVVAGLVLPPIDGWGGYSAGFLGGTIVAGCLFAAGLLGLAATPGGPARGRRGVLLGIGALGSLATGLHLAWGTGPSGGAASSSALGGAAVALTVGWLAAGSAAAIPAALRPRALRATALAALALAVAIRLPDYLGAFADSVRADLAFGRLPVPLLALALGIVALVLTPRRRRVPEALGVRRRTRSVHLWYATAAFLLLPFGLLYVPLPFQAGGVPSEDDARRIVEQLLTDTYEAFDLADEEVLYDRLAETVTGDLLPTLFLENRRGLASGTGDATEVSVLAVEVAPGGAVSQAAGAGPAFTWTGEWAVSARVAHLVHVHLRENLYAGRLVVRRESDGWKLDAVELTAEDRVARPWSG